MLTGAAGLPKVGVANRGSTAVAKVTTLDRKPAGLPVPSTRLAGVRLAPVASKSARALMAVGIRVEDAEGGAGLGHDEGACQWVEVGV